MSGYEARHIATLERVCEEAAATDAPLTDEQITDFRVAVFALSGEGRAAADAYVCGDHEAAQAIIRKRFPTKQPA